MTLTTDDLGRITQETDVVSSDGGGLGRVHQVYTSDATGDPAWVTVDTGRFGSQESFVPLSDATFDGQNIRVAVTQDAVLGAPRVDAGGHLSIEEEDDLYRYYGLDNPDHSEDEVAAAATGTALTGDRDPSASGGDRERTDPGDRTDATTVGPAASPASETEDDGSADVPGTGQRAEDYVAAAEAHPAQDDATDRSDATAVGAAGGAAGRDRDDELAERDAEGRDEVADRAPDVDQTAGDAPRRARESDEDRSADRLSSDRGPTGENVRPGERTTRLRRYVVTERVVQTVEELPEDDQH